MLTVGISNSCLEISKTTFGNIFDYDFIKWIQLTHFQSCEKYALE